MQKKRNWNYRSGMLSRLYSYAGQNTAEVFSFRSSRVFERKEFAYDIWKARKSKIQVWESAFLVSWILRCYGRALFEQDDTIADMVLSKAPAMQKIYNKETGFKLGIFHLENATAEFRTKMGVSEEYHFWGTVRISNAGTVRNLNLAKGCHWAAEYI